MLIMCCPGLDWVPAVLCRGSMTCVTWGPATTHEKQMPKNSLVHVSDEATLQAREHRLSASLLTLVKPIHV